MNDNLTKDISLKLTIEDVAKVVRETQAAAKQGGRLAKYIYITLRENTPDRIGPVKFNAQKVINGAPYTKYDTHSTFKKMADGNFLTVGYGTKLVAQNGMQAPQPQALANTRPAQQAQPLSPQQEAYPAHPQQQPVAPAGPAPADINPFNEGTVNEGTVKEGTDPTDDFDG